MAIILKQMIYEEMNNEKIQLERYGVPFKPNKKKKKKTPQKKEYYGDVRYENENCQCGHADPVGKNGKKGGKGIKNFDWASLEYWDVVPSKNGNYVQSKYIPVNPNEINKIKPIHSKYTNKQIKDGFPDGNGSMI